MAIGLIHSQSTIDISAGGGPNVADFFMSPTGSDTNNGLTALTPFKTFSKAFSVMTGGKHLCLLDGVYSPAAGTGCINFNTAHSAQPPNGTSRAAQTIIFAQNDGGAIIDGVGDFLDSALFLGRSTALAQYIKIQGIKFTSSSEFYHTNYCFVKNCGFLGGLGVGTNDVDSNGITLANTFDLIEDCWVWGSGIRGIAANYQAYNNIWRRVIVRGDGCNTADCIGSGNPNIGITIYNSHHTHFQNVFLVDRILGGGEGYADFAGAQHDGVNSDAALFQYGDNWWEGCASFFAPDSAWAVEADTTDSTLSPQFNYRDCVAVFANSSGFNVAPASFDPNASAIDAKNLTAVACGLDAFRMRDFTSGTFTNSIGADCGGFGSNMDGLGTIDHLNLFNNANGNTGPTPTNVITSNPRSGANRALLYPLRVEAGSPNKGTGVGGGDIGANIIFKWGTDGAFYGDPGWDTLTTDLLWPYPNEARIRSEMQTTSAGISVSRGFCAPGETLTHYLWNAFGNGSPY